MTRKANDSQWKLPPRNANSQIVSVTTRRDRLLPQSCFWVIFRHIGIANKTSVR